MRSTYRLGSAPMINALGMVRWAINGYAFPRDRKQLTRVIADGWSIPDDAVKALLSGAEPFTIDGTDDLPVVVFSHGEA